MKPNIYIIPSKVTIISVTEVFISVTITIKNSIAIMLGINNCIEFFAYSVGIICITAIPNAKA